jgi:hypothetical protein
MTTEIRQVTPSTASQASGVTRSKNKAADSITLSVSFRNVTWERSQPATGFIKRKE